jgi:hypothetical protein
MEIELLKKIENVVSWLPVALGAILGAIFTFGLLLYFKGKDWTK